MNAVQTFSGSGGLGGILGGSNSPTVGKDTLRSKDRVEIILGLCVGPIKGLTNGQKSFFFGSTALQNLDGSYNIPLFTLDVDPGNTPATPIIPLLGGAEDWRGVNQDMTPGTPIIYTSQANSLNQIILRYNFKKLLSKGTDAQLAAIPGAGNIQSTFLPNTAVFEIKWKVQGASDSTYVNPFLGNYSVTGKTDTGEIHEIRFIVSGPGPYVVSNKLITGNSSTRPCQISFEGVYEVSNGTFGTVNSSTINQSMAPAVALVRTTQYPPIRKDGTYGIDIINLRLQVAQLFHQDDSGNVTQDTINVLIEYKASSSGTWLNPFNGQVVIHGKTTTGYVADYRWPVAPISDTYDIRVTRISPDDGSQHIRVISWESFQEVVGGPAQFDGVATVHIIGQSSDEFSQLPDMWGVYDLKLCRIPVNYDPYARVYTGVWDGTFKEDWTSNPAWCLYDLMTNSVDGAATYWPNLSVDKYSVYNLATYCDEPVPNGSGGVQPRYTCNGLISTPRGIRDQIRYMAGLCNATLVDDLNGNVSLVWDHETDAVAIFTPENTIGNFAYTYTDPTTRANDITVRFNNPLLNYQIDSRHIEDDAHIARYGRVPLTFDAIMCTDAHEAVRRAAYKLLTGINEREIVSFTTNRQGMVLRPFDKILVGDPDMGYALTGRIKTLDATRTLVTLRDALYLEVGVAYTFQVQMTNPAYPATSDDAYTLVSIPFWAAYTGQTELLELNSSLPVAVYERAQFTVGGVGSQAGTPKPYKITKVENANGDMDQITIEAVEVYSAKYSLADNAIDRNGVDYLFYPKDIIPPSGLTVSTQVIQINNVDRANIVVTWVASPDPRVTRTFLQYRINGDTAWIDIAIVNGVRADVFDVANAVYDFRISSGRSLSDRSIWIQSIGTTAGTQVPPDDVAVVNATVQGETMYLTWLGVAAQNVSYYWIRFSPVTDGSATWTSSTDLISRNPGTSAQVPATPGAYFVKAVNTFGTASVNAGVVTTNTTGLNMVSVDTTTQEPTWAGVKTSLVVEDSLLKLDLSSNTWGTYEFVTGDLGAVFTSRITLSMVFSAELAGSNIDSWDTLSDVINMSGVDASQYTRHIYISISLDGTTFAPYQDFATGYYTGRQFKIQVYLVSNAPNVISVLESLSSYVQMPNRLETGKSVSVSTSGSVITFTNAFHAIPTLAITGKNPGTGDYYLITAESESGFTITYYDSTNTAVSRIIDWVAVGYGAP